jgi:hypothetical protein
MKPVDAVARAEISRLKVQLHQMTTALQMSINAFDVAFKATERVIEALSTAPHQLTPQLGKREIREIRNARGQVLNMRTLLR